MSTSVVLVLVDVQKDAPCVDLTVHGHVHSYYAFANAGIPAFITGGGGAIPERFDAIGRQGRDRAAGRKEREPFTSKSRGRQASASRSRRASAPASSRRSRGAYPGSEVTVQGSGHRRPRRARSTVLAHAYACSKKDEGAEGLIAPFLAR